MKDLDVIIEIKDFYAPPNREDILCILRENLSDPETFENILKDLKNVEVGFTVRRQRNEVKR